MLLFVLLPLIAVVWVSFFSNKIISFPPQGYSLDWYANGWRLDSFRDGFLLSVKVSLMATVVGMALGVPAALALVRGRFPGKAFVTQLLMSPMMIPGVVAGSALYVYFIQFEMATEVQLAATLPGLVAAHAVLTIPWTMRLVTASLIAIGGQVEEAAMNLGATPWTTLRRVTLPMARPGLVAAGLFSFIVSFTDLEKSIFLIGPGETTLPIAILNYLEWNLDPTVSAVATVQILIIGIALVVSDRYVKLSRAF
ncbi:MAG: Inner membrane ABC transporter permease protein YdcV [Paracidovorax wautersii]|uniref:Inner membrane ABC transporter permease protein YdcV n=1 Tax=Paracidovorax wautersii TaxID=1177982 RepID=A0A7V8JS76_9BURK|nr:MAG: Inner membrane ABC transporter permease protein YdcV [Paracidovorax wautersii]